jgi:hypothetical protein
MSDTMPIMHVSAGINSAFYCTEHVPADVTARARAALFHYALPNNEQRHLALCGHWDA